MVDDTFLISLICVFQWNKVCSQYLLYPEIKCFNDSLLIIMRYNVQAYDIMQLKGKIKGKQATKKGLLVLHKLTFYVTGCHML